RYSLSYAMAGFSEEERVRYSRHFVLPGFGPNAQEKLKNARVVVIGAGGLGAPVLSYLAAAGIGHLVIVDFDTVSLSNLQRQVLFTQKDLGKEKAIVAADRLKELNPLVNIEAKVLPLTSANALDVLKGNHVVVDCTDNFPARYLLNDACVLLGLPLVYGS